MQNKAEYLHKRSFIENKYAERLNINTRFTEAVNLPGFQIGLWKKKIGVQCNQLYVECGHVKLSLHVKNIIKRTMSKKLLVLNTIFTKICI